MPDELRYQLHSVSVVVTAEFHNPSILNPDFLVSRKIVPEEWEVVEAITTPPVSIVKYGNGISWTVEQSNLTVVEDCGPSFQDDYIVYSLVAGYLEALPHVPYRNLGLNCVISIRRSDPAQWLMQRFLKSGPWLRDEPRMLSMLPNFTMDAGDATCNLSLKEGNVTAPDGEPMGAVIVNCNMHHAGPLGAKRLCAAIENWPARQKYLDLALESLFAD